MSTSVIQISQLSIDDFLGMLEEKINLAIERQNANNFNPDDGNEFYTRSETANKLKVSLSTLHNWSKGGILIPQKIGNRVYYSKTEVLSKLKINA